MSSFEFLFLGWLFASQKMREMLCISRPEFALQTRAIRGSAIAPAASLASLSPVAEASEKGSILEKLVLFMPKNAKKTH